MMADVIPMELVMSCSMPLEISAANAGPPVKPITTSGVISPRSRAACTAPLIAASQWMHSRELAMSGLAFADRMRNIPLVQAKLPGPSAHEADGPPGDLPA